MRKVFFKLLFALELSLFSLCGCAAESSSTLSEISRPWSGEYHCQTLTLGEKNLLSEGYKMFLTLDKEDFSLRMISPAGESKESGTYAFSEEEEKITFYHSALPVGRSFPMKKGKIYISENVGGQIFLAVFAQ